MSAYPEPEDDGTRALLYATGRIWDALRGAFAAYQIDTGNDLDIAVPAWDGLSPGGQLLFLIRSYRDMSQIFATVGAISREVTS